MSQSVVLMTVSNDKYEGTEIDYSVPDREKVENIASEMELTGDITCEYAWYEIGEGESGTDMFFTEDEIKELTECDVHKFEKVMEEQGFEAILVEHGTEYGYVEEE